jgi:hypothetical protein
MNAKRRMLWTYPSSKLVFDGYGDAGVFALNDVDG